MADEIGSNLNGAQTIALFPGPGGDAVSPVALTAIYTAVTGDTITLVKFRVAGGSATTVKVGLFGVNGSDQPTGAPIYTPVDVVFSGTGLKTQVVSWALTNGVRYALAVGAVDAIMTLAATTQANGTSQDDSNTDLTDFVHVNYGASIVDISGDITATASATSLAWITA